MKTVLLIKFYFFIILFNDYIYDNNNNITIQIWCH